MMAKMKDGSLHQISFDEYRLNEVSVRLVLNESSGLYSSEPIRDSETAVALMTDLLKGMDRELFCVINLSTNMQPINYHIVSMGAIDSAVVPVPNVFKTAIIENAAAIIAMHCHPSGSVTPSNEDVEVTKRLSAAACLMGIKLLDHIIVGAYKGERYSFKSERPELFTPYMKWDEMAAAAVQDPCGIRDAAEDVDEDFDI